MSANDYNADLCDAINDLLAEGELEKGTPAYGIAQQVIYNGYSSFSPKQRTLYEAVVIPALQRRGKELRVIQIMNSVAS